MHATDTILGQSKIRLFLTMAGRLHRDAVLQELVLDQDIELVGESGGGSETVDLLNLCRPSTLVIEENLHDIDGLTAAEMALELHRGLTIILLVDQEINRQRLSIYLDSGIKSVVSKSQPLADLLQTIHYTRNGNIYLDPDRFREKPASVQSLDKHDLFGLVEFESLSEREQAVAKMLANQVALGDIAKQLGVASKTIHTYKERIFIKLGIQRLSELVLYVKRLEFVRAKKELAL